jgi:hypothetical protein
VDGIDVAKLVTGRDELRLKSATLKTKVGPGHAHWLVPQFTSNHRVSALTGEIVRKMVASGKGAAGHL